jgi:hypothetical protein
MLEGSTKKGHSLVYYKIFFRIVSAGLTLLNYVGKESLKIPEPEIASPLSGSLTGMASLM